MYLTMHLSECNTIQKRNVIVVVAASIVIDCLKEMKEQIALIEELIRRGNSARALVAYQTLLKTIPNIRLRKR